MPPTSLIESRILQWPNPGAFLDSFDLVFGTGRCAASPIQDPPESLAIRAIFALLKEPLRFHRRDLLRCCDDQELVQAGSVPLADLFEGSFQRNRQPQGKCGNTRRHFLILLRASAGRMTSIPKVLRASRRWLSLNVTIALACPFTAASKTSSSPGSRSCGRQRKNDLSGSANPNRPSTYLPTSNALSPEANRCSANVQMASYSKARATVSNMTALPSSILRSSSADPPRGLRIAAITTSVSSTSLT